MIEKELCRWGGRIKLHHIGYVVTNLDLALKRWLKEGAKCFQTQVHDPTQDVLIQFLEVGEKNPLIELIQPHSDQSPVSSRLGRGGGYDHLGFWVDSLEQQIEREKKNGGQIVCPPTYAIAFDSQIAFCLRRSGALVEFIQEKPKN